VIRISLAGESVTLLAERALFWEGAGTLLAADVHLGKAAAFRAAAIPLPGGTTTAALVRLTSALARTGARRLVLLGDFFHARSGRAVRTLAAIAEWRERHADLEILLVRGNHDRGAGDPPREWRFDCRDEPWAETPFAFRHYPEQPADPAENSPGYVLAGHLHPAVALAGPGRQRERLPCFLFGERVGILPAFGDFTGGAAVRPRPGDRVFAVAGDEVVPIAVS
jgi:DNA ligase-associated metallophosphoesterase